MKHQSYFFNGGMEDFLTFIRNITPCTFLFMFAKIAHLQSSSGVDFFMTWVLIAIAYYGFLANMLSFARKMHVYYSSFSFDLTKGSSPAPIKSAMMKLIEFFGLCLFMSAISLFGPICTSLANKGASEYLRFIN